MFLQFEAFQKQLNTDLILIRLIRLVLRSISKSLRLLIGLK